MRCAVIQPSYIPWRGYFDMIGRSDVFVFYDDVQFDKHGWRNRNRIKTANGPGWLTIPGAQEGQRGASDPHRRDRDRRRRLEPQAPGLRFARATRRLHTSSGTCRWSSAT